MFFFVTTATVPLRCKVYITNVFAHSSKRVCEFKQMHLHIQANTFAPQQSKRVKRGKRIHKRRRTRSHAEVNAETNVLAREPKNACLLYLVSVYCSVTICTNVLCRCPHLGIMEGEYI